MTPEARKARERLAAANSELVHAAGALLRIEQACQHTYGAPVSDPIVTPGYHATSQAWHPGREEDHQIWVNEQRTPRWARTCIACGKVEHTCQVDTTTTFTPRF